MSWKTAGMYPNSACMYMKLMEVKPTVYEHLKNCWLLGNFTYRVHQALKICIIGADLIYCIFEKTNKQTKQTKLNSGEKSESQKL